jgi:hypothetical protein
MGAVTAAIGAGVFYELGKLASEAWQAGNYASAAGWHGLQSAGHGVVGGGLSEATGGNFKDGFIGAAAGAILSPVSGYMNKNLGFGKAGTGNGWQLLGRTATAATVGGTVTAISGGKFGNGAATAAFMHLVNAEATRALFGTENRLGQANELQRNRSSFLSKMGRVLENTLGRLWALPNTAVGLVYGLVSLPFGAKISFADGVMRFTKLPKWLMPSAMSLGDVNVFGVNSPPDGDNNVGIGITTGQEEAIHSRQARVLGPLYFPAHIAAGIRSVLTPIDRARFSWPDAWHRNNFLETGPMQGKVFRDPRIAL